MQTFAHQLLHGKFILSTCTLALCFFYVQEVFTRFAKFEVVPPANVFFNVSSLYIFQFCSSQFSVNTIFFHFLYDSDPNPDARRIRSVLGHLD